jgi:NitT/TauT family transport system substrate-binding protein
MKHYRLTKRKLLIGTSATALVSAGMASYLSTASGATATIRLGVLKFGTVNWELNVIKHHGLDLEAGINLDVVGLANKDATAIAFNAGDVDLIVTDWIWTSRQRDAGADCTFVPYSVAAGSVMVHPDSGIETLSDLKGKKIGVAGSPIDKSWLLLRAYTIKTLGEDLEKIAKPIYAAPPLLNEKFKQREFDAVLNYWNYTARLRAAGMKELIKVQKLLPELGVPGRLPLIGYVFGEKWAETNLNTLEKFFHASTMARQIMLESDAEWERLRPFTMAKNDATLVALRDGYRDGVPRKFGKKQSDAIRAAFEIVAEHGGRRLVGKSTQLAAGTLWPGKAY